MYKSNLSADAQCFIPSKETNQNNIPFGNSIDTFNYHRTDAKGWYGPYMFSVYNNFHPNTENVRQIPTLQTHQQDELFREANEVVAKSQKQCPEKVILKNEEKQIIDKRMDNMVQDGRIIVSKSSKKRKAKKNKTEGVSGHMISDETDCKVLEDSSPNAAKCNESTKSVRSWSEVVSRGSHNNNNNLSTNVPFGVEARKTTVGTVRILEKKLNKTQSTVEFSKNRTSPGEHSQSHASLNKNASDGQPQKVKILRRNEKLEDVLIEEKIQPKKKKGKTKRALSLDRPMNKQTSKPVKLTDKPITLNILDMISKSKKLKDSQAKEAGNNNPKSHKTDATRRGPNLLDSTAVAKRGKEREKPKEKKPTKLKKVIIKDRMLRRSQFLQSLGLLETRSLERLNVEYDLPLVTEDEITKVEFPTHSSALDHLQEVDPRVVSSLHSRRFREYCDQLVNKDINDCCTTFLKELVRFQDNQFHKDPVKARIRKRLVFGLREVLKFLGVKKMKCVIISPNLEKGQSEGGLEEKVEKIITSCQINNIPFIFALNRRQLGFTCLKKVPISVVGILNYDGAETHFQKLKELTESAREKYKDMVFKLTDELMTTLSLDDETPDLGKPVEGASCDFDLKEEDAHDDQYP